MNGARFAGCRVGPQWTAGHGHDHALQGLGFRALRASVLALLATALNAWIVSTIVVRLFAAEGAGSPELTHALTLRWNCLNLCRLALVGALICALFQAYRRLDRLA